MKLAVIGSRGFSDYNLLSQELDKIQGLTEIVSGGARGADSLAARYARLKGLKLVEFLPNYTQYGRSAPHVRNSLIVEHCDKLIAFWDGASPGTRSTIEKARKVDKLHSVVRM